MAISSIGYTATIVGGVAIGSSWLNDTGADVDVGSVIRYGSIFGVVVGGNSQDGSTKVLSTTRGTVAFGPPGFQVNAVAFTTDSWATGSLLYWDLTNSRLTSTAAGSGGKVGYAANSKAAAASNANVFFGLTLVV